MSLDGNITQTRADEPVVTNTLDLNRSWSDESGNSRREFFRVLLGVATGGTALYALHRATHFDKHLDESERAYLRSVAESAPLPWQVKRGRQIEHWSLTRGEEAIEITRAKSNKGGALYVLILKGPARSISYRNRCVSCRPEDKRILDELLASAERSTH